MAAPFDGGVLARGLSAASSSVVDRADGTAGSAGNGMDGGSDGSNASSLMCRTPRPSAGRGAEGDGGSSGKGALGGVDAEKPGETGTKSSSLSLDRRRSSLGVIVADGDGIVR